MFLECFLPHWISTPCRTLHVQVVLCASSHSWKPVPAPVSPIYLFAHVECFIAAVPTTGEPQCMLLQRREGWEPLASLSLSSFSSPLPYKHSGGASSGQTLKATRTLPLPLLPLHPSPHLALLTLQRQHSGWVRRTG